MDKKELKNYIKNVVPENVNCGITDLPKADGKEFNAKGEVHLIQIWW